MNKRILKYLSSLRKEARMGRQEKRMFSYSRAIKSIREHGKEIKNGEDAKKLKYIGPKIANQIDKFIKSFSDESLLNIKVSPTKRKKKKRKSEQEENNHQEPVKKKKEKKKKYLPRFRSAPWAIIVVLYVDGYKKEIKMKKQEIVDACYEYTETEMLPTNASDHYSGWSSMNKTLIKKELVSKSRQRGSTVFELTEEGKILARSIIRSLKRGNKKLVIGNKKDKNVHVSDEENEKKEENTIEDEEEIPKKEKRKRKKVNKKSKPKTINKRRKKKENLEEDSDSDDDVLISTSFMQRVLERQKQKQNQKKKKKKKKKKTNVKTSEIIELFDSDSDDPSSEEEKKRNLKRIESPLLNKTKNQMIKIDGPIPSTKLKKRKRIEEFDYLVQDNDDPFDILKDHDISYKRKKKRRKKIRKRKSIFEVNEEDRINSIFFVDENNQEVKDQNQSFVEIGIEHGIRFKICIIFNSFETPNFTQSITLPDFLQPISNETDLNGNTKITCWIEEKFCPQESSELLGRIIPSISWMSPIASQRLKDDSFFDENEKNIKREQFKDEEKDGIGINEEMEEMTIFQKRKPKKSKKEKKTVIIDLSQDSDDEEIKILEEEKKVEKESLNDFFKDDLGYMEDFDEEFDTKEEDELFTFSKQKKKKKEKKKKKKISSFSSVDSLMEDDLFTFSPTLNSLRNSNDDSEEDDRMNIDPLNYQNLLQPDDIDVSSLIHKLKPTISRQTTKKNGLYEIVLLIDQRERYNRPGRSKKFVFQSLRKKGVSCELGNLGIGDMLWIARNKVTNKEFLLDFVVERKTIEDLASSIMDGRYMEQKYRLKKSKMKTIYYLIEGNLAKSKTITSFSLQKAMLAIVINNPKFRIKKTQNIDHTIEFLINITNQIKTQIQNGRIEDFFLQNNEDDEGKEKYVDLRTFNLMNKKNADETISEVFGKQLYALRGCSMEMAFALLEKYPIPSTLIDEYNDNNKTRKEKEELLKNIKVASNTEAISKRNIGKALSKNIFQLFNSK